MIEWFDERYISRGEHKQVVDYYRKPVAQLFHQVRTLRAAQADAQALDGIIEHSKRMAEREIRRSEETSPSGLEDNVIHVDFRRGS